MLGRVSPFVLILLWGGWFGPLLVTRGRKRRLLDSQQLLLSSIKPLVSGSRVMIPCLVGCPLLCQGGREGEGERLAHCQWMDDLGVCVPEVPSRLSLVCGSVILLHMGCIVLLPATLCCGW